MANETRITISVPVDIETMDKMALFCKIFSVNTLDKLFLRLIEFADEVLSEESENCDCDPEFESCAFCDCGYENGEVPIGQLFTGNFVAPKEVPWSDVHKLLMVYIEKHKN